MYELGDKRIPFDQPKALLGWNPYPGCKRNGHGKACRACCALNEALRHANAGDPDYQKILIFRDGKYRKAWNGKLANKFDNSVRKIRGLKYEANIICTYQGDISRWSVAQIVDALGIVHEHPQHTFWMLSRNPAMFYKKLREAATLIKHRLPRNMIFATSVESSEYLYRIKALKSAFSMYEKRVFFTPLLGDIGKVNLFGISAVHVWAEAHAAARPCKKEWVVGLAKQCDEQNIQFIYAPVWAVVGHAMARSCSLRTGIRDKTKKQWTREEQFEYPMSRKELHKSRR